MTLEQFIEALSKIAYETPPELSRTDSLVLRDILVRAKRKALAQEIKSDQR